MKRTIALMSICLGVSFIAGCGDAPADKPELGNVHGLVLLDGNPLAGVRVYFQPESGRPSIGITDEAGSYEAKYLVNEEGVKTGPCTVSVEWGEDEVGAPIPARYNTKTELKLDVKPGDNTFDIAMDPK